VVSISRQKTKPISILYKEENLSKFFDWKKEQNKHPFLDDWQKELKL
jgi:hypothetical protein